MQEQFKKPLLKKSLSTKLDQSLTVNQQSVQKTQNSEEKDLDDSFSIKEDALQSMRFQQHMYLSQKEQITWLNQIYQIFKQWNTLKDSLKENVDKEKLLKIVVLMTESQDKLVKYRAIVASIQGFQILSLKEIFVGQKEAVKPPIMRPKSGRKSEILPSIMYGPHQISSILVKMVQLTLDPEYSIILQPDLISPSLVQLLSRLSYPSQIPQEKLQQYNTIVLNTFIALKNLSLQKLEQKNLLLNQSLTVINAFFHTLVSSHDNEDILQIYTCITAFLRNLTVEQISVKKFSENKILQKLAQNLELYPKHQELVLNTLRLKIFMITRIISKISLDQGSCQIFMQNKQAMLNVSSFFKLYTNNIYVLIRVTFFLANMTTYFQDIREMLYFEFERFGDIYVCLEYLMQESFKKEQSNLIDQFGITKSGWDFSAMKTETPQDALIKVVRLIANLLTAEKVGQDLISNKTPMFIDLILKLKVLLRKYINLKPNEQEAASCVLSCLTNTLYYEKQMPISDFTYKNTKIEIIQSLGFFIIQNDNEDVCCDGLRVVSNLSRQKVYTQQIKEDMVKHIVSNKVLDGMVVLLDSTSLEVVYYCIGVFLNLLQDDNFRKEKSSQLIDPLIQIIKDSSLEQRELVTMALKCLTLIVETKLTLEQNQKIESILLIYGEKCDQVLQNGDKQPPEVLSTRQIIHGLMNKLPEHSFECDFANCGRKFQSGSELQVHKKRRHQL